MKACPHLGPAFREAKACPAGGGQPSASRPPLLTAHCYCPQEQGYFLRERPSRQDLHTFLHVSPSCTSQQGGCPTLPPALPHSFVLTLIQVIMERARMAGAGGRDLRARHVTVGREGDVAVPACLQAHLLSKHLREADGDEEERLRKTRGGQWEGSPTLLLSSSSKEK